jgi:hypothetical protein
MRNVVIATLRASGALEDVRQFAESLVAVDGKMEQRRDTLAKSGLPEAWWYTEVALRDQAEVAGVLDLLFAQLAANAISIGAQAKASSLLMEIDCTVKGDCRLLLEVSAERIATIAELGASLSFDLYPGE